MPSRFSRRFSLAIVGALLSFALFFAAAPAAAQDDGDYPRVGVGITISDINTVFAATATEGGGFVPLPSLLVPIDVNERFRVERSSGYCGRAPRSSTRMSRFSRTTG